MGHPQGARGRAGRPPCRSRTVPVPEPSGPHEVLVRVTMAAGVNFNGVWAARGRPVSGLQATATTPSTGSTSPAPTRRASCGRSASEVHPLEGRATTWSPTATRAAASDPEVQRPRSAGLRRTQRIWGYETTLNGSFAQFHEGAVAAAGGQAEAHLSWEESASYGLTYFTAYRMLIDQRPGPSRASCVLVWGAAGGLGVFAHADRAASSARRERSPSSASDAEGRAGQGATARPTYINRKRVRRLHAQGR